MSKERPAGRFRGRHPVWKILACLARAKVSEYFKQSYEPLFFDARLSFAEEIEKWRVQPMVSLQLVTKRAVAVVAGGGEHGAIS